MTPGGVNLHQETWQLAGLVIALLQPVLIFLLIGGLVLATTHLLTMLGTRWGDRRVTSKSMFFSFGLHLLLACGLIALIPEYRPRLLNAKTVEYSIAPIQITTLQREAEETAAESGAQGDVPAFERMLQSGRKSETQQSRTAPTAEPSPQDSALSRPNEIARFEPPQTPDLSPEPLPPPTAMPDLLPAEPQESPPQADANLSVESLATQARREVRTDAERRERVQAQAMPVDELVVLQRPTVENLLQPVIDSNPSPQVPYMEIPLSPQVERVEQPDSQRPLPPQPAVAAVPPQRLSRPEQVESTESSLPRRTESRPLETQEQEAGLAGVRSRIEPVAPSLPPERPGDFGGMFSSSLPTDQPMLARQPDPFLTRGGGDRVPSAYRLRTDDEREGAILKFGGSAETEAAVDRSLKWLASAQHPEGYWDASEYGAGTVEVAENGIDRREAGKDADVGVTALAVLAFLGKLNTLDQGEYSPNVTRALQWIVSQQTVRRWEGNRGQTDGFLGGKASDYEAMYCHGMATFALAEAYAMSRDKADAQWLRRPLERAVYFILDTQISDGGWRYLKGQPDGDMSMFGWQLMALKSAEAAGIAIPEATKTKMRRFLSERRRGNSLGLAGYRADDAPSASMTAEALYCRQMMGMAQDAEANREAVAFLLRHPPARASMNLYYWYYGTLAMYQQGGSGWDQWNAAMRDLLVAEQRQSGPLAGSWDPRDLWGGYGGRVYSTAIATLSLEVYYRYLPLYRLNEN